jgi:LysM repeat protein
MNGKSQLFFGILAASMTVCAATGKEEFLKRQAFAEMQRVSGQIDVLQNGYDELSSRIGRLESKKVGIDTNLKSEIDALKADIAQLRREISSMRNEIVSDLASRISKVQRQSQRQSNGSSSQQANLEKCKEYVVRSGDSLFLIAQAFNTTVPRLKKMNGLKSDNLKIGQKLLVPKN